MKCNQKIGCCCESFAVGAQTTPLVSHKIFSSVGRMRFCNHVNWQSRSGGTKTEQATFLTRPTDGSHPSSRGRRAAQTVDPPALFAVRAAAAGRIRAGAAAGRIRGGASGRKLLAAAGGDVSDGKKLRAAVTGIAASPPIPSPICKGSARTRSTRARSGARWPSQYHQCARWLRWSAHTQLNTPGHQPTHHPQKLGQHGISVGALQATRKPAIDPNQSAIDPSDADVQNDTVVQNDASIQGSTGPVLCMT